jgi:folate-binding protein YgfZ
VIDTTEAETAPVAYPLERDVLVVSGPDAADYLQGQVSQDIASITEGGSAWSFVLAPTGKVAAWFRISRRPDDWILDVDAGYGEALAARLQRFLLRTDATIEQVDWAGVAVRGPGSGASLSEGDAGPERLVTDPSWPGVDGVDLLGPAVVAPEGLSTGTAPELDALRIRAGVPAMGAELDDSTIPAASGVVERSVSFTKGCYTGQELVARINSRGGTTPTRLCGLRSSVDVVLSPGDELVVDGDVVATVTSVGRVPGDEEAAGLAYVKRAVAVPVDATVGVGPDSVRLVDLPH